MTKSWALALLLSGLAFLVSEARAEQAPSESRTVVVAPSPKPKIPPPPAKLGCFKYGANGWQETACATDEYVREHYPHPEVETAIVAKPPPGGSVSPLVYTLVDLQFQSLGSYSDNTYGTGAFSLQNNTNLFPGSNGHQAGVQFAVQTQGSDNGVCVWNVDVTTQSYGTSCVTVQSAPARGIEAGDEPRVEGRVLPGDILSVTAYLPWAPGGISQPVAVNGPDSFGLAANFTTVSGSVLGYGNGSQLSFANADVWVKLAASNCQGDDSPGVDPQTTCPGQVSFQPFAAIGQTGGPFGGTAESNNLVSTTGSTIEWPNANYAELGYEMMVPVPGCSLPNVAATCVAEKNSTTSETDVTVACPAPPVNVQTSMNGGFWVDLPNHCTDNSPPGACAPSLVSPREFVVGTQWYEFSETGPPIGSSVTLRACNSSSLCTPFQVSIPTCASLPSPDDQFYLDVNDSPLQVVQGSDSLANLIMAGPWVAGTGFLGNGDFGNNAVGTVLSTNLPPGAPPPALTLGYRPYPGGAPAGYGQMQITVWAAATAPPGPYTATVQARDLFSNVTHQTIVPIQILAAPPKPPCVPRTSCAGTCGSVQNGCGGFLDCGGCASGDVCSNTVCCPPGSIYAVSIGVCEPTSCPTGETLCYSNGKCLKSQALCRYPPPYCQKVNGILECQ